MGVNPRMILVNVVFCTLICIIMHNLWGMPLFIVIYLFAARLSVKEPDYFNLNMKYLVKGPPVLNRWYCGEN